nr:hypothetical protein [Pseudoflavonifractor sp. BIOML-A3]
MAAYLSVHAPNASVTKKRERRRIGEIRRHEDKKQVGPYPARPGGIFGVIAAYLSVHAPNASVTKKREDRHPGAPSPECDPEPRNAA